jgi:hypothetical protein
MVSEDGIQPRAGERWRIDASTTTEPYATSICLGSHRLRPVPTARFSTAGLSFDTFFVATVVIGLIAMTHK